MRFEKKLKTIQGNIEVFIPNTHYPSMSHVQTMPQTPPPMPRDVTGPPPAPRKKPRQNLGDVKSVVKCLAETEAFNRDGITSDA